MKGCEILVSGDKPCGKPVAAYGEDVGGRCEIIVQHTPGLPPIYCGNSMKRYDPERDRRVCEEHDV